MLYRVSVAELKRQSNQGRYVVVVMQYYPRFLSKEKIDEYVHSLAPSRELFTDFKSVEKELGSHNEAFEKVEYEGRFSLTTEGEENLRRLSEMSRDRDVLLVCQCGPTDRCHADLLLLQARRAFGAKTQFPRFDYPIFEKRLQGDVT